MKKKLNLVLILVLIAALLTGCGASNSAANDSADMSMPETNTSTRGDYDYGYSVDTEESIETPSEPSSSTGSKSSSLPDNVKVIYTANLELETTEFDATVSAMEALVASMGGYYERSSVNNYSNYRSGSYTVRVPAENFNAFRTQVGNLCQLNYTSTTAEDVSEYYYDTEARLLTQQTKLDRLQDLLSKAETMEDIITIESAISETEYMIEQLTGTLRHYDSLVGYSTVHIELYEVYKLTDVEQPAIGFGAKLANAFKSGCARFVDNLEDFAISFASHWVGWIIFLAIAACVATILVKRVKRTRMPFTSSKRRNTNENSDDAQK